MAHQDTCKWLVSVSADVEECGKPAITRIRIRNKVVNALLPVCKQHKAMHDSNFAQMRSTKK